MNDYLGFRTKPGGRFRIKLHYLIPIVLVLLSFIFALFDKGPLVPPFPDNFYSIDCHGVKFIDAIAKDNAIHLKFYSNPSVEYPPAYLPHFFEVDIKTNGVKFKHSGDFIENATREENILDLKVRPIWTGPSAFSVKCLNFHLKEFDFHVPDMKEFNPKLSFADDPKGDIIVMHRACLEYDKWLFFTPINPDLKEIFQEPTKHRFEFLNQEFPGYLDHKKVSESKGPHYMIATLPHENWKVLLLTMIPLEISIKNHGPPAVIQIRENFSSLIHSILNVYQAKIAEKDPIHCYEKFILTRTYTTSVLPWFIQKMLSQDLNSLKNRYHLKSAVNKRVVIPESLSHLKDDLINHGFSVGKFSPNDPIIQVMNQVSEAQFMIADHISSLVHLIWLNREGTIVIDVSSPIFSCNKFAEQLSQNVGIKYLQLHTSSSCKCSTFECYPFTDFQTNVSFFDVENFLK